MRRSMLPLPFALAIALASCGTEPTEVVVADPGDTAPPTSAALAPLEPCPTSADLGAIVLPALLLDGTPCDPAPAATTTTTYQPPTTPEPYYPNCDAAEAAGVAPLHLGDPGYRKALDGDGDGTACDQTATD